MRWLPVLLLLVACGGVTPRPEQIEAQELPVRALAADERQAVAAHTAAAFASVAAGEWGAARTAAEAALKIDPRAARARALRARCSMQEAQRESPPLLELWRRAEGELLLAARVAPEDPEIALIHAELLSLDGHLSAAAEVLDRMLGIHPRHLGCLRLAARVHYDLAEERAALPLLLRLLEADPGDATARFRSAQCRLRLAMTGLREAGEEEVKLAALRDAAEAFRNYREAVPDDAEGHAGEAFARLLAVQRQQGTPDPVELEAIAGLYETASELAPESPEADFNRGAVLELAGDQAAARAAYERALERDPEHLPALLNLAASLAIAGQRDVAVGLARRALLLGPTSAERRQLEAFIEGR